MSRPFDVILIGSGISSLTSALLLAKKGKRVLVLEQYTKAGGYLHCFQRFGERYDTGAHYVGAMEPGQPFHTLLNYLGVYDPDLFQPLDPEGFDEFLFPDFRFAMPKGYVAAARALSAMFPTERAGIDQFFALVQRAVRFFPTYQFNDDFNEIPAAEIFETSLGAVVRNLTRQPQLQCLLFAYCTLHGVMPDDMAFGFHAIVLDSLLRGPQGLASGGDSLVDRFVQQIRHRDGEVLLNRRVTALKIVDRHARYVECADGSTYSADWVISGLHPKTTMALCDDQSLFPSVFKQRLENLRESVGLLGISVLQPSVVVNPLRNYFYFDSSDPSQLLKIHPFGEVPSVVFLSPARRQQGTGLSQPLNLHSPGPLAWFQDWQESRFGRRPEAYRQAKQIAADRVFDLVERYQPGFRAPGLKTSVSTPLTNLHFNGSVEGTAYGLYHSMQNTGPRAIGPRTKVLNLLLTGQNALVPGLLGAAISGLRTSGHILGIKPLLSELKALGEAN